MEINNIKNPLLKSFLLIQKNYDLLNEYLNSNDPKCLIKLESNFLKHYKKALILSYFSKSIHFFAQNFDKKNRVYTKKNTFNSCHEEIFSEVNFFDIDNLENEKLAQAINKLSSKNKDFLKLHFGYNLNLTEISKIEKISLQAVSKRKKHLISQLKKKRTVPNRFKK